MNNRIRQLDKIVTVSLCSLALLTTPLILSPLHANADEWGQETEAPTLFTGETVMICKKRGPLGACLETSVRTAQNDNDKALKYFKDPSAEVKRKQQRMLETADADSEGSVLIQKLRQKSIDNKERNDDIVRAKTLMNDTGASFGPFSQQVVILNADGKTFTLLQNPQAMRLKKAGYIDDRKFVVQPSKEVIDEALEGKNELGDAFKSVFGLKSQDEAAESGSENSEAAQSAVIAESKVEVMTLEESSTSRESKVEEVGLQESSTSSAAAEAVATE